MRLANSEIVIEFKGKVMHLRPSLRAASRLYETYGNFKSLADAVIDGSATAVADVIREGLTDGFTVQDLASDGDGLAESLIEIQSQVIKFIGLCAGVTDDKPRDTKPGKPIPFDEYFANLFRIGTGWLGWTPDQTWAATPAEISEAQRGRIELLKAMFGSKAESDDADSEEDLGRMNADRRARLNAIGNLDNHTMPK